MLTFLKNKPKEAEAVNAEIERRYNEVLLSSRDRNALLSVIKSGYVEAFDRYDSDVAEQFIHITEEVFGEKWHLKEQGSWTILKG
jgi:hypothetical protein